MSQELDAILEGDALHTLFQPVVDGATREAYGFEALTRGPPGSPLHSPAALFAAAAAEGRSTDLERACLRSALRSFHALQIEGKLFVNVLPETLMHWDGFTAWLGD